MLRVHEKTLISHSLVSIKNCWIYLIIEIEKTCYLTVTYAKENHSTSYFIRGNYITISMSMIAKENVKVNFDHWWWKYILIYLQYIIEKC